MPAIASGTFLSLRGLFKKSGNKSQKSKLKSRLLCTPKQVKSSEPLRINSANDSGPSSKEKCHDIAQGLSLKGQNDATADDETNVVMYVKEYQVPSVLDVNDIQVNNEPGCLEMATQNCETDNPTMQTSITNIELKIASLASMQAAINKNSWEIKFVKSELNKKANKS